MTGSTRTAVPAAPGPAPDRDARRRWALLAAAVSGTLAATYLALAGTSVGRKVAADDLWFFQVESLTRTQLGGRPALVLAGLALAVFAGAWLLLGLAVRLGAGTRAVAVVATLWSVPLAIGIPLFSPDVYHYAAVGASMQNGVHPFTEGPDAAGDLPGIRGGEPIWLEQPSPYSPLFVRLLGLLGWLFDEDVRLMVVALRVLTVLAIVASAVCVLGIARRCGLDPAGSLWLVVANPVLLLHGVSGSHNDAIMLAFVLAGAWAAFAHRPYLAVTLCAVGAGVKIMALAVVAVIAVDAAWRLTGTARRVRRLAQVGGTGLGVFLIAVTACGYGLTWVGNVSVPGLAQEPLSPPTALAYLFSTDDPPVGPIRAVALGIGALVCLWLLTRVPEWGILRATGWIFVTVVVSGSVVWPWYLSWPLAFLALTGVALERRIVVVASVAAVFLALPGGQGTLPLLGRPLADAVVVAGVLAALGAAWWHRRRRRPPVPARAAP
ncbi:polyprenol phosphomannose-dependent alpha 1,6 mannosyltransferase MptB [Trujillonella humicola]|uniref:polyprenol phosphomannose-dependent alpha 1,6 mannosyltransferase MptB n=1 Tax=Trujillonella humicola TaxID=3383699 RepID=UPI0039064FC2